jgi:hypothetical protein
MYQFPAGLLRQLPPSLNQTGHSDWDYMLLHKEQYITFGCNSLGHLLVQLISSHQAPIHLLCGWALCLPSFLCRCSGSTLGLTLSVMADHITCTGVYARCSGYGISLDLQMRPLQTHTHTYIHTHARAHTHTHTRTHTMQASLLKTRLNGSQTTLMLIDANGIYTICVMLSALALAIHSWLNLVARCKAW